MSPVARRPSAPGAPGRPANGPSARQISLWWPAAPHQLSPATQGTHDKPRYPGRSPPPAPSGPPYVLCGNRGHAVITMFTWVASSVWYVYSLFVIGALVGGWWRKYKRATRRRVLSHLIPHLSRNLLKNYNPVICNVRSPGQVEWANYKIYFQLRYGYAIVEGKL